MSLDTFEDASFLISMSSLSSKLWIPESFSKKYGNFLAQEALLMIDNEYGKCWKVKIKAFDGCFCFANGWPEFAYINKLTELDHCVFELHQDSTFRVTIFGIDGVTKKPDVVNNRNGKRPIDCISTSEDQTSEAEVHSEGEIGATEAGVAETGATEAGVAETGATETGATGMVFDRVLKSGHMKSLMIPMAFAEKTRIASSSRITLDYEGNRRRVVLHKDGVGKIFMRRQWRYFCKENNFSVGTPLVFEYNNVSKPTLHVIKNS